MTERRTSSGNATGGFTAPPPDPDEDTRLRALEKFDILDSQPEVFFERLASFLAQSFNVSIAFVGFIDKYRQWFKASVGLDISETNRDISFCGHTILRKDVMVVPDATADPRFAQNPLVTGAPDIRFYAAAPVMTADGHAVGTVSIVDTKPRPPLTDTEKDLLRYLADTVRVELERRIAIAGMRREIASRRETEEELRAKTALINDTLEGMAQAIMILDRNLRLVYHNSKLMALFEYPPGFLRTGMDMRDILRYRAGRGDFGTGDVAKIVDGLYNRLRLAKELTTERTLRNGMSYQRNRTETSDGGIIITYTDITARKKTELALEERENLWRGVFENTGSGIAIRNEKTRGLISNRAIRDMLGYTEEELEKIRFSDLYLAAGPSWERAAEPENITKKDRAVIQFARKDGQPIWLARNRADIFDEKNGIHYVVGMYNDLSPLIEAQEKLRQSQKMESLGQLVGGIAHDFNNLLTVMLGNLEMLRGGAGQGDKARRLMDNTFQAAQRAAALTGKLLSFSRHQVLDPQVIDPNEAIARVVDLLSGMLGPEIRIETKLADSDWPLLVDETQLEISLMNLAINARDAMPDGGTLTIESQNRELTAADPERSDDLAPGFYVRMSVRDTGTGIAPEILNRIFDPFFSTKTAGSGTGLGLSMIYGFAQQTGGAIRVASKVGHGATFTLYLPRAGAATAAPAPRRTRRPPAARKRFSS